MDESYSQNPYALSSAQHIYPESISFEGVVTEEFYRRLLPRGELVLFLTLAFLLIGIALPILIPAVVFAIFIQGEPAMIIGTVGMALFTLIGLWFCTRMASTRARASAYLRKFPDLLGEMKGNFSSNGLILSDSEKTHWFPWILLSHMIISDTGVRVPLGRDGRRFLALAAEMFDSYRPNDMQQLLIRNRSTHATYDQLVACSAVSFQTDVGSTSYFNGWFSQRAGWDTWVICFMGPVSLCIFIAFQTLFGEWSWLQILLVVFFGLCTLSTIRPLIQLCRNQGKETIMCWGWLTDTDLIYGSGYHVTKFSIDSVKYNGRNADALQFILTNGANLFLFRSFFRDTNHFDKVNALFELHEQLYESDAKRVPDAT